MKKSIVSVFLAFVFLAILVSGCAPAPTTSLKLEWLVTEKDISEFTNDVGIIEWKLNEELPGNDRICRSFVGTSWSVNPNLSGNCINLITAGSTFEEVIASLYDHEILYSTDVELTPVLSHDHDFALYAYQADNGHMSYNAFLVSDGLLFRSTVTIGSQPGDTPESLFEKHGEIIEAFLTNILLINLERVKSNP